MLKMFFFSSQNNKTECPMGGKAKSRYQLGMLKVNKLRHNYLNVNVMKLESYGPIGECLNNDH